MNAVDIAQDFSGVNEHSEPLRWADIAGIVDYDFPTSACSRLNSLAFGSGLGSDVDEVWDDEHFH